MGEASKKERGILGTFGLLVGAGCLIVALISVINVAFDLNLAFSYYGSRTQLPKHYDEVFGLAAAGVLFIGLSLFGGFVRGRFVAARGKPLVRAGIVVGALALLVLAGRGLQIVALVNTYGSMLAYYSTDGDLSDVKSELAKKPTHEDLDSAVWRAAQYDNAAALALLLEAGADMRDATTPEEQRSCAIVGKSHDFIKTAIEHGVKSDACPRGEGAVLMAITQGKTDAEVAKTVTLLRGAGFPTTIPSEPDAPSPGKLATEKSWPLTQAALGGSPE